MSLTGSLPPKTAKRDRRHGALDRRLAELRSADVMSRTDIALRWLIIAGAALVLSAMTMDLAFLAWAAVYMGVNAVYIAALHAAPAPVTRRRYLFILGQNAATSTIFTAMPVYMLLTGTPAMQFMGIFGIVGMCLHNLLRHRSLHPIVYWDIFLMIGSAIVTAWVFMHKFEGLSEQILILVSVLAISGYFAACFLTGMKVRERLARAEELRGEAQKMEAVGRLTGGVAHDFNNILTVILGNLDLYQELDRPEDRDAVIEEAHTAAGRAARLTAQLLSFSRRATLLPETIDLCPFINEIGGMLRRILPPNITLDILPCVKGQFCHADPTQLSAALLNLVINARDAMPEGGHITLSVTLRMLPDNDPPKRTDGKVLRGRYFDIKVTDSGPGIPAEMLGEVLTPFFTTKPLGKGSGLGLSMVLGFAEQTEGALTLRNRSQGGLEATLTLPGTRPPERRP